MNIYAASFFEGADDLGIKEQTLEDAFLKLEKLFGARRREQEEAARMLPKATYANPALQEAKRRNVRIPVPVSETTPLKLDDFYPFSIYHEAYSTWLSQGHAPEDYR